MDSNNWRPAQNEAPPPMDGGDWRSQLLPESRQRIVNKIMETLKRHLPFSGQEGLQELKQIAIRFEEKIYSAATSQSDYLRKISLKMLTMESKSQNSLPNALPSNSSVPSQNMQSQVQNQSQSVPHQMASNQSQARQQILAQNMQNNIGSTGMQTTASLPNSLPSVNGLAQNMPNVPQNTNMQSISGIPQNSMGNTMNQAVSSTMFTNSQRQLQGRQHTQQVASQQQQQQQQSQNNSQYMYQQQLQQQMMKQKLQPGNIQQPIMQTPLQQQPPPSQQQQTPSQSQQNLLQANQQPIMQTSSVMQPSMISGLQQNQQSSIQQPSQSVLQQHQQSVARQQQQSQQQQSQQQPQQTPIIQQQQTQLSQQSMMTSQGQQQQQLMGQQPNAANMQQNQLIGQQSNISDMQQQQQQRLLGQQNNLQNLSSHQNMQQQHMMSQQSNLSNMHQQQLGHQSHAGGLSQQQLMGTQSGNANMQSNQHSAHMMQQPKAATPQQNQNTPLLPSGGQPAQPQSQSQQQLMSQLQSQSGLQQQLGLQQQANSVQHNMQPRMQNPNSLLQQQNMIDQQKQFQPQRAPPEAPSSSLDSTAQTDSTGVGDWQEEVYQKIKAMKDMYLADLNEMHQKISMKLQQHESLPQQPKTDQADKLRIFKNMLEKLMQVLQTAKNSILPTHREKLPSFEKQIVGLLSTNRPRRPIQPGQILPPQMQNLQQAQQPHSQISQAQSHVVGVNPQLQSMNLQGSAATIQQNNVPSLQHGSVPSLSGVTSSQQSMASSLQANPNINSGQGSAPSSMQQVAIASLQQNPVSAPPQANVNSLQSQNGVSMLQPNINSHQSNSNMLQNQQLKQHQEQQILQSQQLKQHLQNRHFQQQLIQKQQLYQQQQQLQQAKQQQQQASQISAHQMPQLHQNDVNDKMRQGLRSGAFPQHLSSAQRFAHQQLKPGATFSVTSPQLFQAVSPQINQNSPQIDQQNLQSISKGGTPLQSANSPYVPSPSTPLAPSPMPGDAEKPAVSSLSNAANIGNQQSGAPAATQSLSIGTPGISPSPLFECAGPDGAHGNNSAVVSGKSSLTEQPLDRLLKAVKSISPKALNASVCDIGSVVSMIDLIAGSAPGNGSRATVGEDLVAMTKCRLQARNFQTQDGSTGTKRMRRYTSAMPLNVAATIGSMNDNFKQFTGSETSDLESTATSNVKKAKLEVNHALLEEIRDINDRLIDTIVDVSDEDMDPSVAASASASEGSEGTIVRCSFSAISLSPDLKSHYTSAQMSPIQLLRLLVPVNYPNCSPILLDKLPVDVSNEYEDLSVKAKSRFSISLRSLSQPMSLKAIARTWDDCARAVICEYAQQNGGGTFSSKYGTWENCLSAA
ncbi:mediator of RNA polymerase II transcription subunit 15a-like isoform X2 [Chenopodium quinoa]|uniref:mediator of RNA polymerase II transcription subunit 15a-like isoform X2 n=1 Tax=Chenopodium quinoa TaxID=63459 RepID=UPI000B78432F|nr:mediator of RNA polymerase II transcription subunit 15a-like isoform X2 [Chenopodium quinoa]